MKKWHLVIVLVVLSVMSLFIGIQPLCIRKLIACDEQQWLLLLTTRIPRTVSLILAGAMTSIAGQTMQHLFQNRFVSPNAIGMMDSARLGILLVMLCLPGSSLLTRASIAFVFAYSSALFFLVLARLLPQREPFLLPLTGMMFSNVLGAITTFIAYRFQIVQNVNGWLQGDFASIMSGNYELIYITVPIFIILYYCAYQITVAGLGQQLAQNLGLNLAKLQFIVLALIALSMSAVLLMVGNTPFLGVVIPNIVALFYGDYFKKTLPITALLGSIFLIMCDLIARTVVMPFEVPVSVVLGVIGGALFIYLLAKRRRIA